MTFKAEQLERTPEDETRWNGLLSKAKYFNYMGFMSYVYSRDFEGRQTTSFIFTGNGKDIAGAHYVLKKSVAGIIKTADFISGIIFKDDPDAEVINNILKHFICWAKDNKASFIRFTPAFPKLIKGTRSIYSNELEIAVKKLGFSELNPGRNTYWLNLGQTEEQLLSKMNRKTRYDINQALKSDIVFTRYDNADIDVINHFWILYNNLGVEKKFRTLSEAKFKYEVTSLLQMGLASLFLATFKKEVVNISLVSRFGISSYLYGAINPEFKNLDGCPSPGHVAQWEMIKSMKNSGLKIYDLGYCPGSVPDPQHPAYKIWRFKFGFGGDHIEFLPVYGKILKPIRGRIFKYIKYRR